ncbi:MAG: hypothetical protein QM793_05665 [Muricomes sp.]
MSNVSTRLTSILMNSVLLHVGGHSAVSVYGILVYAGDILQQLLYGTCDSMKTAIGYNLGAGKWQTGKRYSEMLSCRKCCHLYRRDNSDGSFSGSDYPVVF